MADPYYLAKAQFFPSKTPEQRRKYKLAMRYTDEQQIDTHVATLQTRIADLLEIKEKRRERSS